MRACTRACVRGTACIRQFCLVLLPVILFGFGLCTAAHEHICGLICERLGGCKLLPEELCDDSTQAALSRCRGAPQGQSCEARPALLFVSVCVTANRQDHECTNALTCLNHVSLH